MAEENTPEQGYIYILQNDAHDPYILKIGLTRHAPDRRAQEIYWGATGVPLKYNVAVAFSVGDCVRAEKIIHQRLDTYRINPRREFFKVRPNIAAAISLETCKLINKELEICEPEVFRFTNEKAPTFLKDIPDIFGVKKVNSKLSKVKLSDLKQSPVGTSTLSAVQIDRIRTIQAIFYPVYKLSLEKTIENFTRDSTPEVEIIVWENMAKVFQAFDSLPGYNQSQKEEAFKLNCLSTLLPLGLNL